MKAYNLVRAGSRAGVLWMGQIHTAVNAALKDETCGKGPELHCKCVCCQSSGGFGALSEVWDGRGWARGRGGHV